jgi:O-antigen/teichoic acid export membrane protein
MSLKHNVIANYLGQGWRALMSLLFVPLYIKYLGVEAYGLIGIFSILQAWLSLLDFGMKPALGREMARFSAGICGIDSTRDLLRSVEIIGVAISTIVAFGIWGSSHWLATRWLRTDALPPDVAAHAFAIMGCVVALRFVENIYVSCVIGLQRQVFDNVLSSSVATVRGLGAVIVLIWISPTISAFFIWQGMISLVSVFLYSTAVSRMLPSGIRSARFSPSALLGIWRFAAGMIAISFLALLVTQVDKMLLSRILTLKAFGYYALAGAVTNVLYNLVAPISAAFYPRFTEIASKNDQLSLVAAYHLGTQLVSVLMGSAAIVLAIFGTRILRLWTDDLVLTQHVAEILPILAIGTLINGLMWIPHQMQLAHAWTSLGIKVNVVSVAILIPTLIEITPHYGAVGAAWCWVALNIGNFIFFIYFMHRRILIREKWRWFKEDVAIPLITATALAEACRWLLPQQGNKLLEFSSIALSSLCVLGGTALTSRLTRAQIVLHLPKNIKSKLLKRVERR